MTLHPAALEPHGIVAETFDEAQRVRHEQNRLPETTELREFVEALVRESLVADREDFVYEQHVGIDVDRHRKPEPHVHAGGVGLDRCVDEFRELGEVHDVIEPILNLPFREAEHDPVDEDVLATRNLGVKSRAELDQRRHAAVHAHDAAGPLRDPRDELQRRALPRSISANDTEGRALRDEERHVVQRGEDLARL